ncbi:hypothetical protein STRTUCAR8_08339 [Streptomyces turgidiscabies Car8]|uniref:Uncharacterized protein n=1 Tax=Streptomyces turgidiscabies (strain Car8) TaxID=698760 RepID=L7F0X1_STRT8|nr:hypothetical protein STRTUCAR8_08339 [Streptomyces turgidiscabies Car8]
MPGTRTGLHCAHATTFSDPTDTPVGARPPRCPARVPTVTSSGPGQANVLAPSCVEGASVVHHDVPRRSRTVQDGARRPNDSPRGEFAT